jgi:hypothetical protein
MRTPDERRRQEEQFRRGQLQLCAEPDHQLELARRNDLAAKRGAARPDAFEAKVRQRRLERERSVGSGR